MKKINPEVKKLWVEALLSGNYKQGMGIMRSKDNFFCIFGVLCDVFIKNVANKFGLIWKLDDLVQGFCLKNESYSPPKEVLDRLKVKFPLIWIIRILFLMIQKTKFNARILK